MVPFEYFEHTADIGLLARGPTLGEAFANAGRGLVDLLVNPARVRPREARQIALASENVEDLLVDWLNELLFLFDSEGFVPVVYEVAVSGEARLEATLGGEPFDPQRHEARGGVKAATYHQVAVEKTEEGYVLRVILDV
ncbi:MAG: archease [Chloroflexota bacterium]